MTPNLFEKVVADREKFSLRLGAAPSFFDNVGKPLATGGACATMAALIATHIAGPATVIKILGITIYASSGPVGWAIGTAAVAFGAGYSAHVLGKAVADRFGNTGTYRKEFDGNLSEIGKLVADFVFRPMVALAMPDWSDDKRDYILRQFDAWGYDGDWSRGFLRNLREDNGDILVPVLDFVSGKGFGRSGVKDKAITKRHLLDLAIKSLDVAALDFDGGQEIIQERKEVICRQLECRGARLWE